MASIAVSAVVKPSRLLMTFVTFMCVMAGVVAWVIGTRVVGDLPILMRSTLAGGCWVISFFVLYRFISSQHTYHIDITSDGRIRLAANVAFSPKGQGKLMQLSESTFWPMLMILHLRHDTTEQVVRILPDSLSRESFRALSVACRWIASRDNQDGRDDHHQSP